MSTLRKVKKANYTCVDNAAIEDERLSFKAMGMLVYLLSRPDDWTVSYRHLESTHTDGAGAVRTALKELEDLGYLHRKRQRSEDGTFFQVTYICEEPCVDFPRTVYPSTDNRRKTSTEGTSTEEQTPKPPSSNSTRVGSDKPTIRDFLDAYPMVVNKKLTLAKWREACERVEDPWVIVEAARIYSKLIENQPWRRDRITYSYNWLDRDAWEDDDLIDPEEAEAQRQHDYFNPPPPKFI